MAIRHVTSGQLIHKTKGFQILKYLMTRSEEGGRVAMLTGAMGTGKSTLMVHFLRSALELDKYIIWRLRPSDSITYLPDWKNRVVLFKHEMTDIELYEFGSFGRREVTDEIKIIDYRTATDVIENLKPHVVNLVADPEFIEIDPNFRMYILRKGKVVLPDNIRFLEGYIFWYDLLFQLVEFSDGSWRSIFIDEIDDIAPAYSLGIQWRIINWFKDALKDFRKARMSLYATAHSYTDIDSRLVDKIPTWIFFSGAKVPKRSLVNKTEPAYLEKGEVILEDAKIGFGRARFPPLKTDSILVVKTSWKGEIPDIYKLGFYVGQLVDTAYDGGISVAQKLLDAMISQKKIPHNLYPSLKELLRSVAYLKGKV